MQNILVIRFGSLGDLCLLGWSLSRLAQLPGHHERTVTLVTKAAFAPLAHKFDGVDGVIALQQSSWQGLRDLAGYLRDQDWHHIVDAHGVLRSHALLLLMGRRAHGRIGKDTVQRLALLRGASGGERLARTMHQRFDGALSGLLPEDAPAARAPLLHLRSRQPGPPCLALAPGAQWDTKRWPEAHFTRLLQDFRERSDVQVRVFLGPREESWFTGSKLAATCDSLPQVEVIRQRSLGDVASLLARCTGLVTNDSGLLHVAEAVGTPVLACFGPTVREFGYYPCLPDSQVLEVDLDCRPCSRNGKRPCHRGDLACLAGISPEQAWPWLERMFPA